ncbi:arylsulfatase [Limibaculum sp. FT325]|uniref:arylsulfatase n=1 Tax=Thermohalobaculum sediminis TaxID=2939436 RepID=UPI0020C03B8E|nr:arylsulfatase [Limibaculum sediminis]MCL5776909.1 arylsulfatase [Limibaculum sediminis]
MLRRTTRRLGGTQTIRFAITLACLLVGAAGVAHAQVAVDRTVLPIAAPPVPNFNVLDVRDAVAPPLFQVKAPEGAPNVLIVLVDDLGFAGTSSFGGPVSTPEFDALAAEGLRFVDFHTTALCSPTRTALKSGRNHHVNNMSSVAELGTSFPGSTGQIPDAVAPLAEILRLNGYSTAAFGKWHETAAWEVSISGPFDRWPTRQGFDKFYGFIGGETNQWAPFIYDGVHPVDLPDDPEYHFLTDMTDQAAAWIRYQKALAPDRPFFVYFAPGAVHAPHHVPEEWSARWKGKFDQGWDELRAETLSRQLASGIVPDGTILATKPDAIPDWDSLTEDEKRLFARQGEVFAGYIEMTDHEIGRVIDAIEATGQIDNTLIFLIYGDNGTSAEGGRYGLYNEMTYFNGGQLTVDELLAFSDRWGSPETYPHMAAGWATLFNTPFGWMKQVGSDHGGTKVGMAVHWPAGIKAKGEQRGQFSHVIDVAPTVLEAAGLPEPRMVNGVPQVPMQGVSMLYAFDDAEAPERHVTQYFEMFGNRALYRDGWWARTIHKVPWDTEARRPLADDLWELFDTATDFSLARDLAGEHPDRLAELQAMFMAEAGRNHVLPLDDRLVERGNAALAGRPDLMAGRKTLTLADGMTGMSENVFINVKNRSKTITARVDVPEGGGHGTILAQAGRFGGWSLYVADGIPAYRYNFLGQEAYTVSAPGPLPAGSHEIRFEFAYDGGGLGKGGTGTLFIDGEAVASGRIERTQPIVFSADETADVGIDLATAVVEEIGSGARSRFTGRIETVTIDVE